MCLVGTAGESSTRQQLNDTFHSALQRHSRLRIRGPSQTLQQSQLPSPVCQEPMPLLMLHLSSNSTFNYNRQQLLLLQLRKSRWEDPQLLICTSRKHPHPDRHQLEQITMEIKDFIDIYRYDMHLLLDGER